MLQRLREAGVVTLVLDRPGRGNALAAELVESLISATLDAHQAADTHTLVLRAQGPHFCTGLDLSDLETASDGDLLHRLVRIETLLSLLWHSPLRTVAVAQGRAWGAGADLFAACEERVALPGASFRFPGAQFGIVLGTRRLAERVGSDAARRTLTQGLTLHEADAMACGLATAMAEPELTPPVVSLATAAALRAATRPDHRDADMAALVRSAAEPGLHERIALYRQALRASPAT